MLLAGGGGGPKGSMWRSGSRVPGDKKAQNGLYVALHAATATECDKKKNNNKGGMLVTEILNTCTR